MDILETLKQKREANRMHTHPLSSLSLNERYTYCFGLAIMAKGNMKTISELSMPFVRICQMLEINQEMAEEMIVDINNHFEQSFDYLMQVLSIKKRISTCFIIDLLKLSHYSSWGKWYCKEVIEQFCAILKISQQTKKFLREFLKEGEKGDTIIAHDLVNEYKKTGNAIDYELLYYMNDKFQENIHLDQLILDQGGCYRIECPTIVDGDIVVKNGTKLYISNTSLCVGGTITVTGARLGIYNSLVEAVGEERKQKNFFVFDRQHQVVISDSTIDLHFLCAGLRQNDGNLRIERSVLYQCQGSRMISFSGGEFECIETTFSDCLDGALWIDNSADFEAFRCKFKNCRADQGGAVYIATDGKVHIREGVFENCNARYLGAAVYFEFKRYEQEVLGCLIKDCQPKKDCIFNAYRMIENEDNQI